MKYYPKTKENKLPPKIKSILDAIRESKSFNPENYLKAKCLLINKYFEENKLDTIIVAISGGIDSAVTLKILEKAKEYNPHIIKKIIPLTLPALNCVGVTNQENSKEKSILLGAKTIYMEKIVKSLEETINKEIDREMSPWSQGQMIPYLRTSLLYSLTAGLTDLGCRTVIAGTTNRDEGSYLGYIGKASDALTDIQIISDLHKNEVYQVARTLKVNEEIIDSIPTGDMFDNRTDEEVFGAPYDFVELYTNLLVKYQKEYLTLENIEEYQQLSSEDKEIFNNLTQNITSLHNFNRHKYISCSSSIHLDLSPFSFPGGWRNNTTWDKEVFYHTDYTKINNLITMNPKIENTSESSFKNISHNIYKIENLLTNKEVENISNSVEINGEWLKANMFGKITPNASIGSYRKSWYDIKFSESLLKRISSFPLNIYTPNQNIQDDESESYVWSLKNVSPLYRFIKYENGDSLVPHYDESYRLSNFSKTLFSLVIYLTEGETRFFKENRNGHNYEDYENLADKLELKPYLVAKCNPGDALIFQHRILHDSPIVLDNKLIIRSDLIFTKPNLGGALNGY